MESNKQESLFDTIGPMDGGLDDADAFGELREAQEVGFDGKPDQ